MDTRHQRRGWRARMPALRSCHAAFALGLAITACQAMNKPREASVVDAEHSLIRFQHADFDANLSEYALERDPRSGNEIHVARFHGADAFAILVAYKNSPSYVMRERPTEAYIANMMRDLDLDWGASGRAASRLGYVPYRLFQVVDGPFSCVGFGLTVGESPDDLGRKGDLVVGFFCHDASRPMSTDGAEELIGKVSLAGRL
jgi:hypothetical protein